MNREWIQNITILYQGERSSYISTEKGEYWIYVENGQLKLEPKQEGALQSDV